MSQGLEALPGKAPPVWEGFLEDVCICRLSLPLEERPQVSAHPVPRCDHWESVVPGAALTPCVWGGHSRAAIPVTCEETRTAEQRARLSNFVAGLGPAPPAPPS